MEDWFNSVALEAAAFNAGANETKPPPPTGIAHVIAVGSGLAVEGWDDKFYEEYLRENRLGRVRRVKPVNYYRIRYPMLASGPNR